jgi:hypothetical protein
MEGTNQAFNPLQSPTGRTPKIFTDPFGACFVEAQFTATGLIQ